MTISSSMPQEDPCLAADESWQGFQRSPASFCQSERRGGLQHPCTAALFFKLSLSKKKKSNICSQGEQMVIQDPMVSYQRRPHLKPSVSMRVVVLKNLHFLLRNEKVISSAEKLQKQWESSVSREGEHNKLIALQNILPQVFFFHLNILGGGIFCELCWHFLHSKKDWTPADHTTPISLPVSSLGCTYSHDCHRTGLEF